MKEYTITIDTGTTNTRIALLNGKRRAVAEVRSEIGVRDTARDGNNEKLKAALHTGILQVMKLSGITVDDVNQVIASGMITSDMGLVEIPHIFAPVGAKELAENAREILIKDVYPQPILFIPGVKNQVNRVTMENFEAMDMMRGEEVETIAVLSHFKTGVPYLVILPGSHTKFVSVDSAGRITGCLTTITGELLSVITKNTLISDSVDHQFVNEETYEIDKVLAGYRVSKKTGIGRGCFSARILNTFLEPDKSKIACYLLGAVFQNDIEAVKNSTALTVSADTTVIVSGKNPLRHVLMDLFKEEGCFANVKEFVPSKEISLSAEGAFLVANLK